MNRTEKTLEFDKIKENWKALALTDWVKQYAQKKQGVVNARMTFDKESLKPLYQLVIGEAGESCAFHIAKRLGMPGNMLQTKGVLRVQLPNKKIWINHKRIKLHVAAQELYPEDYDFSIIFDTVEKRKLRHQMGKHHMEGMQIEME